MAPKYNYKCPYNREKEISFTMKGRQGEERAERSEDAGFDDSSDVAIN